MNRWDRYFLELCDVTAKMSKDPSTQVGAVIVRPDRTVASMGFNGFPAGCDDDPDLYANREIKYSRIVHAEMNAIIHARERLDGYTLYVSPLPSCDRCMTCIAQAGIKRIVTRRLPPELDLRWNVQMNRAFQMALEVGINVVIIDD